MCPENPSRAKAALFGAYRLMPPTVHSDDGDRPPQELPPRIRAQVAAPGVARVCPGPAVGAPTMIIQQVAGQQAPEMTFMENDHRIQAFAPDAADETLDVWIRPRRPGRRDHVLDPHMPHPLLKNRAGDAVPIAPEISRRLSPWQGIDDLLCRPLSRGTRRRSWARISSTTSTLWVTVGTTKKSRATRSCAWCFRTVFPVGDGGFRRRIRYVSTVDFATVMPTFRSSPTIRGASQVGLVCHILRMRSRTSWALVGRPGVPG